MKMINRLFAVTLSIGIVILGGTFAFGETSSSAATPEFTTATYGDWILTCQHTGATDQLCEAATVITPQGQTNPVAKVVVAKSNADQPLRIVVLMPDNISFVQAPILASKTPEKDLVSFEWTSCTPAACVATAALTPEVQQSIEALSEPGRIIFHDSTGREVNIVVPFKGFHQAISALTDQ